MGTNSTIAILNIDGTVDEVYCHYDGYMSYNGKLLFNHYNSRQHAEELIALGSLSTLQEKVKPEEGQIHNFGDRVDNVTVAYHRDRGEELRINKYPSVVDYRMKVDKDHVYNYLYAENTLWGCGWFIFRGDNFVLITADMF